MNNTDKIIEIIRNALDVFLDENAVITGDSDIVNDLKADSLDKVLIVGDIEEAFGIKFDNDDFSVIRTVNDIDRIICKKLGAK